MAGSKAALKSVVGEKTYSDLAGLNEAWDADQVTRKRVRDHQRLLLEMPLPDAKPQATVGAVAKTMDNCRYNEAQLSPLLKRMKNNRDSVPNIDVLMDEIEKTHQAVGLAPSVKTLNDEAWGLRYLLGNIKHLQYKKSAPKAFGLQFRVVGFRAWSCVAHIHIGIFS